MIYATVSLHKYQFDRFSDWILKAIKDGTIKEQVIYQHGASKPVEHKLVKNVEGLPWQECEKNFKVARVVLSHLGMGNFITSVKQGKTPIMVPRKTELKEVADDNQTAIAKRLEKEFGIEIAWTYKGFVRLIKKGGTKSPEIKSEKKNLVKYLDTI